MPITKKTQKEKINQVLNKTGLILYDPLQPSPKKSRKKFKQNFNLIYSFLR